MEDELTKDRHLRNNEYYCMQEVFDFLYICSKKNYNFYHLIEHIISDNNLRLAFRNIKTNKGSLTNGLSGQNISIIAKMKINKYLKLLKQIILDYKSSIVKRVEIPKRNGKKRYLGIKEPIDKIVEQAIYQILEPILTAKFHNNSNGFIKGRSTSRAIAQFTNYVVKEKLYIVIDLDMKGFFDNVNHSKLLKQLWSCGVKDKNLLSIISKMLKAEIYGIGVPNKGTPQGGILSPLLANLVLNEFDWWLDSKSSKGIRFVRYADDIKILCPTYSVARDMLDKIIKWLDKRLGLEVCEEKTKITNLKKNYSYFLGFKFKVKLKKKKYVIVSHMSDEALVSVNYKIKKQIRKVKKSNNNKLEKELDNYNALVRGIHNYYDKATNIVEDLKDIYWNTNKFVYYKMKNVLTFKDGSKNKIPFIRGKPLIEIGKISHKAPRYKGNSINYFSEKSRNTFYKRLKIINLFVLEKIVNNPMYYESVEFNDNVISKFCGQLGKYGITKSYMYDISDIKPIRIIENGTDKYDNIIIVNSKVEQLLKLRECDDMVKISNLIKGVNYKQLEKINKIRKENSLSLI